MKRIMMISEHASPLASPGSIDSGGQNIYVRYLSEQMAARGLLVDIFTRKCDPGLPDIVDAGSGIRVIHVPAGPSGFLSKEDLVQYLPEFTHHCAETAARYDYDLVHAHYFMSGVVACELKWRLGLPFVVTFHALGRVRRRHQADADGFTDERFFLEEAVIEQADGIIAECPQDARDLMTLYSAEPRKISIVPCGVNLNVFFQEPKRLARERLGLDQKVRLLLSVGRLVPRKGVDNIIRALGMLTEKEAENTHLLIVGGETETPDPEVCPEMARLMNLASELRLSERVHFTGRKDPEVLHRYYSAADMFISTPWYEPFGITPLEAMACGTPVIGSRVGGIKFSVVDNVCGLLVPPREPGSLAWAIQKLIDRPALLTKFSAAGKQRVRETFTWERIATQMLPIYEHAISNSSQVAHPELLQGA